MSENGMLLAAVGSTFLLNVVLFSLSKKVTFPHCMGIKIKDSRQDRENEHIQDNVKISNITREVLQNLIRSLSQGCGARGSLLIFATPLMVFVPFSKTAENCIFRDMMKNAKY